MTPEQKELIIAVLIAVAIALILQHYGYFPSFYNQTAVEECVRYNALHNDSLCVV